MANTNLPSNIRALQHNFKEQTLNSGVVPIPTPSETQYLLKTYAVALTAGELQWPRPENLNISSPGVEFVARVVKSPSSSSKFQPGDEVYARVSYPNCGAARDYTVSDDQELALRPKNISIAEAASVPVSALTAWQALFDQFKLTPPSDASTNPSNIGKRILITAASGSVGAWATRLAKLVGLYVVAIGGPKNLNLLKTLGADDVLDYTKTNLRSWVEEDPANRKVDFVFDCAGRASREQAWHTVKDGGELLTIVPPDDMVWKWVLDRPEGISEAVTGRFFIMHPSGEQLGRITKLIDAGLGKPMLDSIWKFDDYEKAFEKLASGKTQGKVVLTVDDGEESSSEQKL